MVNDNAAPQAGQTDVFAILRNNFALAIRAVNRNTAEGLGYLDFPKTMGVLQQVPAQILDVIADGAFNAANGGLNDELAAGEDSDGKVHQVGPADDPFVANMAQAVLELQLHQMQQREQQRMQFQRQLAEGRAGG